MNTVYIVCRFLLFDVSFPSQCLQFSMFSSAKDEIELCGRLFSIKNKAELCERLFSVKGKAELCGTLFFVKDETELCERLFSDKDEAELCGRLLSVTSTVSFIDDCTLLQEDMLLLCLDSCAIDVV